MLTVPKQQPHRRDQQHGSMTTFKNWAAKIQIYMSLEDHNLITIMEDVKTQTVPIHDEGYIDHELHQQELGQEDEEKLRQDELQRRMQVYTTRNESIIRRNAERQQHRADGEQTNADEQLPPIPTPPDDYDPFTAEQRATIAAYTEAFNYYSKALQYTITKVTKNDPHRFVLQCNHNNSSGFQTKE
eukprot:2361863-Amphidinium_carterae.1